MGVVDHMISVLIAFVKKLSLHVQPLICLHLLSEGRRRNSSRPGFKTSCTCFLSGIFSTATSKTLLARVRVFQAWLLTLTDTPLSSVDMVWICNEKQVGDWRTAVLQECLHRAAVSHIVLSRTAASRRRPLVSESRDVFSSWPSANTKGRVGRSHCSWCHWTVSHISFRVEVSLRVF